MCSRRKPQRFPRELSIRKPQANGTESVARCAWKRAAVGELAAPGAPSLPCRVVVQKVPDDDENLLGYFSPRSIGNQKMPHGWSRSDAVLQLRYSSPGVIACGAWVS